MRISKPFLLSLLLVSLSSASARILRGTRTRRVNEAGEKLLFTEGGGEGRKGGKEQEDYWNSGDGGSYSEDYNGKQKGETMYDRSPMKFSKEGSKQASQPVASKQTSKQGSKVSNNKSGAKDQSKGKESEKPVNSYDDVEAPYEGSRSKGDQDEYYDEEEDYDEKPNGKQNDKEDDSEDVAEPAQAPISVPGRNNPPDYQTSMAQVAYVLSQFGLEYTIANQASSGVPTTTDFAEVEAATIAYLEEYLELTYNADATIFFNSAEIEATSRRTGGTGGTPFIDFEASVAFAEDSPMTPTASEIGDTIAEAFEEPNMSAYSLSLANRLPSDNPFVTTTLITVYVPDSNANSDGRVSRPPSKMSAAGIAAAAGTGVVTLLVGGFLLFKIRSENKDINSKFGKPSGLTIGGDTYDNSTLDNGTLTNDDDDRSFLSNLPHGAVLERDDQNMPRLRTFGGKLPQEVNSKIVALENSPITDDGDGSEASDDDESDDEEEGTFQDEETHEAGDQPRTTAFASITGRTKALVPTFKSSHMSNTDIKAYFKSKYKCASPRGYNAVDAAALEPSPSDDQSLNLVLPALDHDTSHSVADNVEDGRSTEAAAKRTPYRDYEGAYMQAYDDQASLASTSPSDEGTRTEDSLSMGDPLDPGSAHRLVATAQRSNQTSTAVDGDIVPRLPSEQQASDDGDTGSVERNMDDVSLGTMSP